MLLIRIFHLNTIKILFALVFGYFVKRNILNKIVVSFNKVFLLQGLAKILILV